MSKKQPFDIKCVECGKRLGSSNKVDTGAHICDSDQCALDNIKRITVHQTLPPLLRGR